LKCVEITYLSRLWTKQLDEGVHAATSVVSSAIAFRYQKLAIGMEALEEFHKKMPDPVKRFDKLLGDMEAPLSENPDTLTRQLQRLVRRHFGQCHAP